MKNKLSYEMVEAQPLDFDFSEGYGEKWDIPLNLTEEEQENEEYIPMMNYLYPLGDSFDVPDDFRDKLNNTTIVQMDDKYFLALTGGGMDMTWEICESYINLGYCPPVHFCSLPAIAGRGTSNEDQHIIACCNESLKTVARWYTERLKNNWRHFPKGPEVQE